MSVDIFIRTYQHDFFLLDYCLKSIKKYVSGYNNVIICVREKEYDLLFKEVNITTEKVFKTHDFPDNLDYCGQQICKLSADFFSDAEYILYVDSDLIFYNFMNVNIFFENGKAVILKDYWKDVGEAKCWQKCLIKLELFTDYELMRTIPYIYPRHLLPEIREHISSKTKSDFINGCLQIYKKCGFSEFNIMGSYALKNNKNISFVFSKEKNYNFSKQFFSHTPKNELIGQINNLII